MTSPSTFTKNMTRTHIIIGFTALLPPFLKKLEPSQLPAMENSPATSPTAKMTLPFMRKTTSAEMFVARFIALLTPFAYVTGI